MWIQHRKPGPIPHQLHVGGGGEGDGHGGRPVRWGAVTTVTQPVGDDGRAFLLHANGIDLARVARPTAADPPTWTLELLDLDATGLSAGGDRRAVPATAEIVRDAVGLVAAQGGGELHWWRAGATPADATEAIDLGFVPGRAVLQMRRPLPHPDAAQWPRGITEDRFRIGRDEADWVALNNAAFAGHPEQGAWTVDTLIAREQEPWFDPQGFVLARDPAGLAGACWTKVHPAGTEAQAPVGEIYVICTAPDRGGQGLGRALVLAGLAHLGRTCPIGMLYVDAANERAVRLYEKLGFSEYRRDRAFVAPIDPA